MRSQDGARGCVCEMKVAPGYSGGSSAGAAAGSSRSFCNSVMALDRRSSAFLPARRRPIFRYFSTCSVEDQSLVISLISPAE
ncbi:hypothetical protein ACH4LE_02840 [Streptomyces sp. NPDC017413]|uniref:hypothetical protein n=1 Tax=Streptomyces sp. NPDC017413 TaxID=3364994 RepID=UPI0037B59DF0